MTDPVQVAPLSEGLGLPGLRHNPSPYHLINAALNIQNSRHANQRGRDAEFFWFSANYVGSECTGYIKTEQIEKHAQPILDLGTAMAISGAAALLIWETTGDQFFSEEQFEAYRNLGFHATQGFFSRRDKVAIPFSAPAGQAYHAAREPATRSEDLRSRVEELLKSHPPEETLPTVGRSESAAY